MIAEVDGDQASANEILKQIKKWDNALKNNDIDQIIQSYTDDFSLFDVSSQLSGLMQYKAELERLSPYLTKNSYIRRRNIKVHVSGDLAFLYFYIKMALLHKGLKDKVILIEPNSSDNLGMRVT